MGEGDMGLAMGCKEELHSPDGATFANWAHADLSTIIWLHTHKYIYINTYIHACMHTHSTIAILGSDK